MEDAEPEEMKKIVAQKEKEAQQKINKEMLAREAKMLDYDPSAYPLLSFSYLIGLIINRNSSQKQSTHNSPKIAKLEREVSL